MRASCIISSLAFFVLSVSSQRLDKPPLQPNLDNLKDGLNAALQTTSSTRTPYQDGYIPQGCKDIVTSEQLNPADVQTWTVQYADCSVPWVLCYHKNSNGPLDDLIDYFGRLPVHTRQWVRHVVSLPASGGHAYNAGGNIAMFGDVINNINVYVHESAHSLDLLNAYADKPLSSSENWINNYNQDPDVPDPYSQTNQVENVAQNTVVTTYQKNVPGGFTGLNPDAGKIFHQWATVDTEQREAGDLLIPGGQCTQRLTDSPAVPINGGSRLLRYRKLDLGLVSKRELPSGITEIPHVDFNTREACRKSYLGE